jgi:outer membrane protein OmpA-like peptidoglycan-associated protein
MNKIFYIAPEEEPELLTLDNLIFARGSDRITESSFEGLDELVAFLEDRPSLVIQLEGHTDFAGNADANMRLSEARVLAVKDYLVKQGVKKSRVLTKAFGGTQPLFTERTDEAKTKNRRVEVRIIKR